jgi:prevent-host-death family protein
MPTRVIEIKDAGAQLAELVESAVRGSDVVLTRNNIPLARIVSAGSRTFGLHRDQVWNSDDFDASLPENFWTGDKSV